MHNLFQGKPNNQLNNIINLPTIGIAGVTIPGAVDCVNKINQKVHGKFDHHQHPNIIMHQPNFAPTHHAQNHNRWDIVESRLIESVEILSKSGADFIIIPANTVHKVIDNVKKKSAIPVLSILDVVAAECERHQLKKVGILGTRWTMAEHLYQQSLQLYNIEEIIPSEVDQDIIQKAIFDELIPTGNLKAQTLSLLLTITEKLKINGCDGIVLACTELPLVLNKGNCGMFTLDTTAILAEAAVQYALNLMQSCENKKTHESKAKL